MYHTKVNNKRIGPIIVTVLLVLLFGFSLFVGFIAAAFGSQSDVSPGEQAACLICGLAMMGFAVVGLVARLGGTAGGRTLAWCCLGGEILSIGIFAIAGP